MIKEINPGTHTKENLRTPKGSMGGRGETFQSVKYCIVGVSEEGHGDQGKQGTDHPGG